MQGASIQQVNAAAFRAVTLTGMRDLSQQLGLDTKQVASMCQQFEKSFDDLLSPLPTGSLDGISQTRFNVAEARGDQSPATSPQSQNTQITRG